MNRTLRVALPAGLALALTGASSSSAVDWSFSGFFSERIDLDQRDASSSGSDQDDVALRSVTDAGLSIRAQTKRTSWQFAPGLRAAVSTDSSDSSDLLPRFNGSVRHVAPGSRVNATLSVVPDFTSETQFEDTGAAEEEALQITLSGAVGYDYDIDALNSISLGADVRAITFADDTETLDETQRYGLSATWSSALTPRTTASVTPALRLFRTDDEQGSDGETVSLTFGVDHRVNPRLGLNASLGPSLTRSSRATSQPGGAGEDGDETDFTLVASAGLNYATAQSQFNIGFQQNVDQNSEGDLENRSSFFLNYSHALNSRSRIGVGSRILLQTPLSGETEDRQTFSITPSYSFDMTKDWELRAGYRFRAENDEDFSTSNLLFVQISRGFSLLP